MKISEIITESTLTELTRPATIEDANKILFAAGYEKVGAGIYAEVYSKPGADHVLKLFDFNDNGYQAFIRFVQSIYNPHFPKFKGKLIKVTDDYYAIRMEKLTPVTNDAVWISDAIKLYLDAITDDPNDPRFYTSYEYMDSLEREYPGIREACDLLAKFKTDTNMFINFDVHEDNIMMRGNTLVIIDPFI